VLLAGPQAQPAAAPSVDFVRDIQPILEASCVKCHGPTRARAGLRLDDRAGAMRGGDSGPVLLPGQSGESLIVRRILGLDGEDPMPKEGDRLTAAQLALIRAWIDQGAAWPDATPGARGPEGQGAGPQHWAYVRPAAARMPDVRTATWVRTGIDRFVLARLEREGLTPAHEAPFETLVRRVFLDLVGLPPTAAELDAALADATASGRDAAYERLVDRLLASPHYGERWARSWLDLARYADSHGYEKDRLRVMWKYRDWVIDAINADMPFNQFTIEQIAGDMLPDATDAQRVASGFHRNTMLNQEGGIDVEEARWETLVDRVNTTATVWLGSTVACAQCHDHKYDPFSQRDYYRMLAFFENVEYTVAGREGGDRFANEPQIDLPTADQERRRKQLQAEIDKLNASLRAESPARAAAQRRWEQSVLAAEGVWVPLKGARFASTGSSTFEQLEDGSIVVAGDNPQDNTYTVTANVPIAAVRAIRIEALPDPRLPQGGPGRDRYGNFVLNGFDVTAGRGTLAKPVAFDSAKADDGSVTLDSFRPGADGASYVPRGWTIDATRDPSTGRLRRQAVFASKLPFAALGTQLTVTLGHVRRPVGQSLGRFRLSVSASPAPLRVVDVPARQRAILLVPAARRTDQQRRDAASLFRNVSPLFKTRRDRLASLQTAMRDLGIVTALVMKEKAGHDRPSTFVRRRGNFLDKGQQVFADVPGVLNDLPEDAMPNRLGLARWLVDDQNPLTARVTVNRAWEQFFGRGLVETSEDFGVQGTPPSHPELLDWLAVTFTEQGWKLKPLHRSIVMSATYRQSSAVSAALLERDPYNRLFARGPRFRVEAEMVRDIALTASGLLSRRVGGPSVFPPQPDGIWQNPYSSDKWVLSKGEDRYRRGLYTFLRRTAPYPAFTTFDATSRESCTVRRVRTNTPLQALTTLNDEAFFEAARALARRMLTEVARGAESGNGSDSSHARASHGFRLCVARTPKQPELDRIMAAFAQHLEQFRRDPDRARQVIGGIEVPGAGVAEQAAWTLVANALLNLDETLTKE
jgi:mono/diheme cytochrome c family protein